ncbi:MAG: ORF6N domain-containing protein [Verrucomicrobia bacterium]|nr:ORF6N domain-containing protein [Verrucomicrobiota bacterium]
MANEPSIGTARIEETIHLIRGQRVMLDSDLAAVYGTTTKRLNEQFKRNRKRFPVDFAFQLTAAESTRLRSQTATSKKQGDMRSQIATASRRNTRYRSWAFTEYGAIMLASVLNSNIAVEASVQVVRAFVRQRELLATHRVLAGKLADLEEKITGHDTDIQHLFETLRQMLQPAQPPRRKIGFHIEPAKTAKKRKQAKSRK